MDEAEDGCRMQAACDKSFVQTHVVVVGFFFVDDDDDVRNLLGQTANIKSSHS